MDFNQIYHQSREFRIWAQEKTGMQDNVNVLLYNTGYTLDLDDFYMTRLHFNSNVWVDHNGREFVVYTRGGQWDQVEAAHFVTELQNAVNLAFHLNSLVQRYGELFEAERGQI